MIPKDKLFDLARVLGGVPVVGCLRGTPAAMAGVLYGDILLSVNGCRVRNFGEYVEAKSRRSDGMSVVLFRSGTEMTLDLIYGKDPVEADPASLLAELVGMRIVPGGWDDSSGSS